MNNYTVKDKYDNLFCQYKPVILKSCKKPLFFTKKLNFIFSFHIDPDIFRLQ